MPRKKTRTEYIALMLTPEERTEWESKANAAGMKLSQYIRHCVERRSLTPPIPSINKQSYLELSKIGVNLNQVVAAFNHAKKNNQPIPRLNDFIRETKKVISTLREMQSQLLGLEPDVDSQLRQ